jgi:hypothetical protein
MDIMQTSLDRVYRESTQTLTTQSCLQMHLARCVFFFFLPPLAGTAHKK